MIDTHDGWLTELRLREELELSETTAKQLRERERDQSRIRTTDYTQESLVYPGILLHVDKFPAEK